MTEGPLESLSPPGSVRWPAAGPVRWPAEWEPHAATWLAWPHNRSTWPGVFGDVEKAYCEMVAALAPRERVQILVDGDPLEERARKQLRARDVDPERNVEFVRIPTDDAWLRDSGPIFVERAGERDRVDALALDFRFDAWGGKYPPWERDERVAERVADLLGVPRERFDSVLEGGSIDGDGAGTLLTTEQCLLCANRTPSGLPRTREAVEALLAEALGAQHVIWLGAGIAGDDTDGHIDDVARFVAPGHVVAAREQNPHDANHHALEDNWQRIGAARDAAGRSLTRTALPMPPALRGGAVHGGDDRLPASYANFYLANAVALVPVFGAASDERVLDILRECLEGREVVPIAARALVLGLGAVHCLTQQQPALPATR